MIKTFYLTSLILTGTLVLLDLYFDFTRRGIEIKLEKYLGDAPKMIGPTKLRTNSMFFRN